MLGATVGASHAAGGEWPTLAVVAAKALSANLEEEDIAIELLGDILDFLAKENPTGDGIRTAALLEHLVGLEDRPWATWRKNDRALTSHGLRRLLSRSASIQIDSPRRVRRRGGIDWMP